MKKLVLVTLVLFLAGSALPLLAATTADFQGKCQFTNCVFDANRQSTWGPGTSCSPSTVSLYFWDRDVNNDNEDLFTTSAFVSYSYVGGYCNDVNMAVFCNNGTSATQTHCLCTYIGIFGCITPGAGWGP